MACPVTRNRWPVAAALCLLALAPVPVPPKPERGRAGADCRAGEPGPALAVDVLGMKDRRGALYLELYPDNDRDFLAADKDLIAQGKPFRRVPLAPIPAGHVELCIRAPETGRYALIVLHDRDGDGKFGVWSDGIGFPGRAGALHGRPSAHAAAIEIGPGVGTVRVILAYRRGFRFDSLASAS